MNPGKVCVAYLHGYEVAAAFHMSMIGLFLYDLHNEARILGGGAHRASYCGTGRIPDGRNETMAQFLDGPAEWLFMVDSDMGFAPDSVDRLIASADPKERPVVGALCFAQRIVDIDVNNQTPRFELFPTVYAFKEIDGVSGFMPILDYQRDSLVRVAATGAAGILIHRSVGQALLEEYGPDQWFTQVPDGQGGFIGEDMSFCVRLAKLDIPIHVDTAVKFSHQKPAFLVEP